MKKTISILIALMSPLVIAAEKFECPDMEANTKKIKLTDTTVIAPDTLHMHSGLNYLNDNKLWAITIGPINGRWSDSMNEAKNIISTITSPGIVKYSQDLRRFYCTYSTENENVFITLTTYEFDEISGAWSGIPKLGLRSRNPGAQSLS